MQPKWRSAAVAAVLVLVVSPSVLAGEPSPGTPADLSSPAAELRVDLDRLLAEHAFLTIEQMRSGLSNGPDFAAAATAVEANSTEVADAIGSIYGEEAVEPFGEIWRSHIGYLVDYAIGLREGNAGAREAALQGLADYRQKLKTFLGDANPGVELDEIAAALDMHTAQLVEFVDATHEGDHARAYAIEREAYPHMFDVGDALARVIANRFPDRFPGVDVAYSAAGTLRVTLDRLLAEHTFLAAEAMRAGMAEAPDFGAAAEAIGGNSTDLQAVVEAAYGADAATAFRELWDAHIAGYVQYIEASRQGDAAGRTAAQTSVDTYAGQLASFLASANPYLDADALAQMFQMHADHLTGQVESFAAGNYEETYDQVRTGYRHMFDAGEALAQGIATQMPDQFPTDAPAPDTATLPHGHRSDPAFPWAVVVGGALLALTIAGVFWVTLRAGIARPPQGGRRR